MPVKTAKLIMAVIATRVLPIKKAKITKSVGVSLIAAARPIRRAHGCWAGGKRAATIEMKTILSIPRTISIAVKATSRSNEGRDYLGLKLDDPSFTGPIYANLFDDEDGDGYSLIWSRPNGRRD